VPPWPALHQPCPPRQALYLKSSCSACRALRAGTCCRRTWQAWRRRAPDGAAGAVALPGGRARRAAGARAGARRTCEATMRPMPSSICGTDTTCVWLPSPESTLERPTSVMPTCGARSPPGREPDRGRDHADRAGMSQGACSLKQGARLVGMHAPHGISPHRLAGCSGAGAGGRHSMADRHALGSHTQPCTQPRAS